MIDPNNITTVRVGQLPEAVFSETDNLPHEVGTELKRGTIGGLATFIANIIETSTSVAFLPITVLDGQTIPATTGNQWFLAGKGTFYQSGGFPDIVCTEELNAIVGNGIYWSIGVEIPIVVDPPESIVTQIIAPGITAYAPSSDAVYEALLTKEDIINKISEITGYSEVLYPNEKATHDALDLKLNISDLPSNLIFYATTAVADIGGYFKLVDSIDDIDFDEPAVDVSTGAITTTAQLISSLVSAPGLLIGNPGIINITTVGNVKKISGTGTANFYFNAYHRDVAGVETLVGTSNNTETITNTVYEQFSTTLLWNDGDFIDTDRIVLKFYANRISGGGNPTYNFQFGGDTPVRTIVPVPFYILASQISLTTIGTSGVATLVGNTLNIPNYSGGTTPNLQEVTDAGATSDKSITIDVGGSIYTPAISGISAGNGVYGFGYEDAGVFGTGYGIGVKGDGPLGGVVGFSSDTIGVEGIATNGTGVKGSSLYGNAIVGISESVNGVYAVSTYGNGIYAESTDGDGIYAQSSNGKSLISNISIGNTSNIAEFQKNNINQASISHDGKISANELKSNTLTALDSDILTLSAGGTNVTLDDTNSTLTIVGDVVADNIVRAGDTNANILLAGGGVAAVSGFLTAVPTLQEVTTVGAETTDKVSILHNSDFNALTVNNSGAAGVAISANGNIGVVGIGDTSGVYGTGYTGVYANGTNRAIYAETSNASAVAGVFNSHLSSTVDIVKFQKNNINQASISHDGKVTANAIIKSGGTSSQFLMADGSTSTGGGATPTLQQVTEAGDITTVPTVFATTDPLSEDINSITATTDNGIGVFASSGTGTAVDAYSTSGIAIKGSNFSGIAILGNSSDNTGVDGTSTNGIGVDGQSVNGIGVNSYSENGVAISADTGLSTTSNIAEFKNNGVIQTSISNDGNVTSNSFIKDGGTSEEFLKADGSVDSNGYVKPIVNEFPGTTVTGTLSETLLSTFTIPGGTLPADCMPDIRMKFSKSGDLGNSVMRFRINTVNNFATATQIGTYAAVAATDTFLISRNPVISGGNMNIFIATSSGQSDTSAVATTESNFTIDVANDIYLFVSVTQGNVGDTTTLRAFKIIN